MNGATLDDAAGGRAAQMAHVREAFRLRRVAHVLHDSWMACGPNHAAEAQRWRGLTTAQLRLACREWRLVLGPTE